MPFHIYWSLVDAQQVSIEGTSQFLSANELQKLSHLRFPKRRSEWLLGRWTAKSLVCNLPAYRHYSWDQIEIRNSPEGTPQIILPDGVTSRDCLSISHRDNLAFCALGLDPHARLGVDLEKIESRPRNFMEDYFTEAEQNLVDSHPAEARDVITTLIWSTKEAMLKALGVGLRRDTRQVEIREINEVDSPSGYWQKLQVLSHLENCHWSAFWQKHGEYLLTIAGFATTPFECVIAEMEL